MATSLTGCSMESTACNELKRKSEDVVWEYGVLVDPNQKDRVKCILCEKTVTSGVNRLKQHIAGISANVAPCLKAIKEDKLKCKNAIQETKLKKKTKKDDDETLRGEVRIGSSKTIDVDEMEESFGGMRSQRSFGPMDKFTSSEDVSDKGKSKQTDLGNVMRKERLMHVKEYVCRWAYECAIRFHAFEKDSFKMLMEAIGQFGPNAQPPSRYEMGETLLKKEVERTKNLLKKYEDEWKLNGCSIMTDAWSDRKRRSIMNLCVNSKLGTVFLSSKESSDEAHTSEHIFEYVDKCIEEVGPEHVVQVVTDNASNNMGAAKLLKAKRPTIFWTSCAAHTVNLMLEAIGGLQPYKKTLDRAKQLTIFIYAHHKTLALMRQYTKKRDIVRPGVTRFASAFLTLQSLLEKKEQLRKMFCSNQWEACKLSKSKKGKESLAMVIDTKFWAGVVKCLKIFTPLVRILRMVDADWKPSMGFLHGELKKAKEGIKDALNNNKKSYEPIMNIIETKMKGRLDTSLHLAAYLLNPFYSYNNLDVINDVDASDAFVDVVETLYPEDYQMQSLILMDELPMYKSKEGKFDRLVAIKGCEVNDDKFDPANWWGNFGGSTPTLRKIAMRILSLTTSSSGCERNWSTFEAIHTKKRNRLETAKLNNLVYVQFNANLMDKNKKRKERGHEVLIGNDASEAQDWIVDEFYEAVGDAMGVDEVLEPRRSARARELFDEEFESDSEEEELDEDEDAEYESDGVQIIEQYGQNQDLDDNEE